MSEVWGSICLGISDDFNEFDLDNLSDCDNEFLLVLFSNFKYEPSSYLEGRFQLENSIVVGDYLCLKVEGEGWPHFCEQAIDKGTNELFASFYDEYGQSQFYARDHLGNAYTFRFEDESDEECQEDFDEQKYENAIFSKQTKWIDLINQELFESFPPLKQYLRNSDEEYEFNWDAYDSERHNSKIELLHSDLLRLLESLESGDPTKIRIFVAEASGLPEDDERVEKYFAAFLDGGKDVFIQALNLCLKTEPRYYLGQWSYGFYFGEETGLPDMARNLVFTFNDDQGRFIFDADRRV